MHIPCSSFSRSLKTSLYFW